MPKISTESAAIAAVLDRLPRWARTALRDSFLKAANDVDLLGDPQLELTLAPAVSDRRGNLLIVNFPVATGTGKESVRRKRSQLTT